MAVQSPVHFDIVGSFLRPERLKKAREAFRSGTLGQAALRRVEDMRKSANSSARKRLLACAP